MIMRVDARVRKVSREIRACWLEMFRGGGEVGKRVCGLCWETKSFWILEGCRGYFGPGIECYEIRIS